VVAVAVRAAVDAAIGPVVVVSGAHELEGELPDGVEVVRHEGWADGQATSLAVGVDRARELGATAVVVGLGDQLGVPAEAWRAVASAPEGPVVTATFGGRRRPPVRLDAEVWPLLPRAGDEGARALMRNRPDLVHEVACAGDPADVDRLEDVLRWT
jgi:CTP:molybdopterin cytidylyltransferase MocA